MRARIARAERSSIAGVRADVMGTAPNERAAGAEAAAGPIPRPGARVTRTVRGGMTAMAESVNAARA